MIFLRYYMWAENKNLLIDELQQEPLWHFDVLRKLVQHKVFISCAVPKQPKASLLGLEKRFSLTENIKEPKFH